MIIPYFVSFLAKHIKLREYSIKYKSETFDKLNIEWFSSNNENRKHKIYYRFKEVNNGILIFLPKRNIIFFDNMRLIYWFIYDIMKLKISKFFNMQYSKELPKWFCEKYLEPRITETLKNKK